MESPFNSQIAAQEQGIEDIVSPEESVKPNALEGISVSQNEFNDGRTQCSGGDAWEFGKRMAGRSAAVGLCMTTFWYHTLGTESPCCPTKNATPL
jgi:hypothetical protein